MKSMVRAHATDVQVAVCQAESGVIATLKYRFCPNMEAVMLTKLMHMVATVTTCTKRPSQEDQQAVATYKVAPRSICIIIPV